MQCPYCHRPARLMDSAAVYDRSHGLIWACIPCDARVGVHRGTETPLGTMANRPLRRWRNRAHEAFDPLWRKDSPRRIFKTRGGAYGWLAIQMKMPKEHCHIAMFSQEQCAEVVRICASVGEPKEATQ